MNLYYILVASRRVSYCKIGYFRCLDSRLNTEAQVREANQGQGLQKQCCCTGQPPTRREKNHHAPACFVWVKALKPAETSDWNASLWCGSSCDVGHPTQSRGCWISCLLGTVEIQFFRADRLYPIAGPIPAFLGIRKLDFAHTPEKHDPMLLGFPITISAQDFHMPPQSNAWPPEKER